MYRVQTVLFTMFDAQSLSALCTLSMYIIIIRLKLLICHDPIIELAGLLCAQSSSHMRVINHNW